MRRRGDIEECDAPRMFRRVLISVLAAVAVLLTGCGGHSQQARGSVVLTYRFVGHNSMSMPFLMTLKRLDGGRAERFPLGQPTRFHLRPGSFRFANPPLRCTRVVEVKSKQTFPLLMTVKGARCSFSRGLAPGLTLRSKRILG
jgi:hypothetical protein